MVLHKTIQHGSTCSFYSAKELSSVLLISLKHYVSQQFPGTEIWTFQVHTILRTTAIDSRSKEGHFLFYLNNLHSQKVKPCGRTTRFIAGLHRQAQKGRWTVLHGGYLASRQKNPWCSGSLSNSQTKWNTIISISNFCGGGGHWLLSGY